MYNDDWKKEWKRYTYHDMGPSMDCWAVYDNLNHRTLCYAYYVGTARDVCWLLNMQRIWED